ncbi:MAG: hypothetical protein WD994_03590 [Pseudomonadales bacterium]
MKILGLPGINPATGPWMDSILERVANERDDANTQYYEFWNSPDDHIDAPAELVRAAAAAPELIIAKSMGTLLTLRGVAESILAPKACVLIGIPVGGDRELERSILSGWHERDIPTLFIQQQADITGTFDELTAVLTASGHLQTVSIPGSDHVYSDVDQLASLIHDWRS